jgi:integrase
MAKKKAKYYQRPDGLYETSRTVNGKRVKFRGRTCAEVDRKILEYNVEKKLGRKLPVIADEWYNTHEAEIRQSTYRVYGFALRRIKEHFPGRIGDIKPLDIRRYMLQFESKGYAKNTVQIELAVLRQIFKYAVMAGDIDVNPAAEVSIGKNLPAKKRTALTEEQERMVENCRTGKWWLLGLMLLYTGCRRGELLALNWQDIDRDAGVVHITKKLNWAYGNTPKLEHHLKSKNGKRDIPLFQPLAAVLPRNRIGRIFTDENGNYLTAAKLDRAWKEYCRDAGLSAWERTDNGDPEEVFPITPHCFRHSFSTICYEAGLDPKAAAAFMGDTEAVVQNVYTDLRERHHASSADKVNAYLAMRAQENAEKQA